MVDFNALYLEPEAVDEVLINAELLNEEITDQNRRHTEVLDVFADDDELTAIASAGIEEEQAETVSARTELGGSAIYTELGSYSLRLAAESAELHDLAAVSRTEMENILSEIENVTATSREALEAKHQAIIERMTELSPRAREKAEALLAARLQQIDEAEEVVALKLRAEQHEAEIAEFEATAATLEQTSVEAEEVIERMGAWPLPLSGMDDGEFTLDEMPVDPALTTHQADLLEKLRRHVDQKDASLYTTLYLLDKAGKTVTVDELADFLYPTTYRPVPKQTIRSRVTSLLGPAHGSVPEMITAEGYVLQYGIRRTIGKNNAGVPIVKCTHRIYRCVDSNNINMLRDTEQETDDYKDSFELPIGLQAVQAEEPQSLAPAKRASAKKSAARTPEAKKAPEWVKELESVIGNRINELEDSGLISTIEPVTVAFIRSKATNEGYGRIFASAKTIDELHAAGYLRQFRGVKPEKYNQLGLSVQDIVLMSLYQKHKHEFGKNMPRQNTAALTLERCVSLYIDRKRAEQEAETN